MIHTHASSRRGPSVLLALTAAASLLLSACGGGSDSSPAPGGSGGAGVAGYVASGAGAPAGGLGGAVGSSGGASAAAGAPAVPAGQLVCAGKQCHGGGRCAADGSCPSFLGECFSTVDHLDTCDAYCSARGYTCAEKACNFDGSGTKAGAGFSLVSYSAADRAVCAASGTTSSQTVTFDGCSSVIWLQPSKPADDVVRCCCRD